jgi:large subunit ribosomal protein L11
MPEVSVMVDGGKATAAAPIGPALAPLGVNIVEVVNEINKKTKDFAGMKVPVKVNVASDKSFSVSVGSPPISAIIKKELGAQALSGKPNTDFKGNLTLDQVIKIARMKGDGMGSYRLKSQVREVVGACNSSGVQVEGMPAKEFQKKLAAGEYDAQLKD